MEYYERLDPALHGELTALPIRGLVAHIARLARRLLPRFVAASHFSETQVVLLDKAISFAEHYVEAQLSGSGWDAHIDTELPPDDYPANEAMQISDNTAQRFAEGVNGIHDLLIYARKIHEIAQETVPDFGTSVVLKFRQSDPDGAARTVTDLDYHAIVSLNLGAPGEFGNAFDPRESGPLGTLWPGEPPCWHLDGQAKISEILGQHMPVPTADQTAKPDKDSLMQRISESRPEPFIQVTFDDSDFTAEEVELFLTYLSEVYRDSGGAGLKVVHGRTLLPQSMEVSS